MAEELPPLTPFDLDDTLLQFSCGAWRLPGSRIVVPMISFAIRSGAQPFEADRADRGRRFIRFRCREVVDAVDLAHGLLIDLGALPPALLDGLDPVPEKIRQRAEPVRILVGADARSCLAQSVAPHEIEATRAQAMAELAFALKRHRHDGGTKILAPQPVPSLAFDPVTLDISEITWRFSTWRIPASGRTGGFVVPTGDYRRGSAGSDDALVIRWRLSQFCEAVAPDVLIIDLRDFEYTWGDDLSLYPPQFLGTESLIRFIIRPDQQESLKGEIHPQNFAFDEASAFEELSRAARELG